MTDYEKGQFEKLMIVVRAGQKNNACYRDLEIKTCGYEPSASVKIDADFLEKWLTLPRNA